MSHSTAAVRVVIHTTETDPGADPMSVVDYMATTGPRLQGGYHVVLDTTGRHTPVQLRPFDVASGSLKNNGTLNRSPNREGSVLIQVALVERAKNNPCLRNLGPYWPELLACVRSWGVPDAWLGPLPAGGGVANKMPTQLWYSATSGWCSHATTPNPDSGHWDPGRVDPVNVFGSSTATPPSPVSPPAPSPSPGIFQLPFEGGGTMAMRVLKVGVTGGDVKSLQMILNGKGFKAGAADGVFGTGTKAAVQRAQAAMGIAQDGVVGAVTTERLYER
jgi:hypothetical protein